MRKIIILLTLCLTLGVAFAQNFNQAQALKEISAAAASIKLCSVILPRQNR